MLRVVRALAPLAVAASLAVPGGAHAAETLTYAFAVPCSGTSVSSALGLPTGTYAVTVTGACIIDLGTHAQPVGGTPCTVPVVGTVPCTSPITTVNNVPGFNQVVVAGGSDVTTTPGIGNFGCSVLYVAIDGNCFLGSAGTYRRTVSGPMTVSFVDSNYADNVGELIVTVVWTPL